MSSVKVVNSITLKETNNFEEGASPIIKYSQPVGVMAWSYKAMFAPFVVAAPEVLSILKSKAIFQSPVKLTAEFLSRKVFPKLFWSPDHDDRVVVWESHPLGSVSVQPVEKFS